MPLPQLPPPVEMSNDTKRAIIDGVKSVIEVLKANGKLEGDPSYGGIIHDPRDLFQFIRAYRKNPELAADIVKAKDGGLVMTDNEPLVCDVSLAQIQQLLVKTCARHFLEQENKEEVKVVTEQVTKKVLGVFSKTETVERKVGGGFDERKVRDISKCMAFDWQLPLLPAYNTLNTAQLFEAGDDLACLQSFEAIKEYGALDQQVIKRAKAVVGEDFREFLANRPAALAGAAGWNDQLYQFYRKRLGPAIFEFFTRDSKFFNVCAALEKPMVGIFGDLLAFIDSANLEEMQRLNIDKADVLVQAMRKSYGPSLRPALSNPAFAKDFLRKMVESLQHVQQERAQLAQTALISCKATAPQVAAWVERQKNSAS